MCIGVAILGAGIFVKEEHMPAVEATRGLTLKAIYSRSSRSAKSLKSCKHNVALYSDDSGPGKNLDDLLSRSDIEAVIIALPIMVQPEFIRKALSAGKHVLSEKPVAPDVKTAQELIAWYQTSIEPKEIIWSVAENMRFMHTFAEAAKVRSTKGRTLTFRLQSHSFIHPGGKYYETPWRKVPEYQGGFLLDGGIHYIAGMRRLMGHDDPIVSVSSNITQLQGHLPPVDTIEATARTRTGAVGSISISFGTTSKGREFKVACEHGVVSVGFDQIEVDGTIHEMKNERTGVPAEVRAWAKAIHDGIPSASLSLEEALADLTLLEGLLRSGEQGGIPVAIANQEF